MFSFFMMKILCLLKKFFQFSIFAVILNYSFYIAFYRCSGIKKEINHYYFVWNLN